MFVAHLIKARGVAWMPLTVLDACDDAASELLLAACLIA